MPGLSAAAADSPGVVKLKVVFASAANVRKRTCSLQWSGLPRRASSSLTSRSTFRRGRSPRCHEHGVDHVNLMSLDVEGFELPALRGLDFSAVSVDVVLVENDTPALFGDKRIPGPSRGAGLLEGCTDLAVRDDVYLIDLRVGALRPTSRQSRLGSVFGSRSRPRRCPYGGRRPRRRRARRRRHGAPPSR